MNFVFIHFAPKIRSKLLVFLPILYCFFLSAEKGFPLLYVEFNFSPFLVFEQGTSYATGNRCELEKLNPRGKISQPHNYTYTQRQTHLPVEFEA